MSAATAEAPSVASETRLAEAFSLRRNARALLTPSAGHLRPLDGLRALSILWVVLFHVGWYQTEHLTTAGWVQLLAVPWMLPVWRGDFGVDVFFVLSGFLIAGMLIDERERTGKLGLVLFYARRLLRLWPPLIAALLLDALLIRDHPDMTWANVLYVSNFLPIQHAGMGWCWSLAIEEQFYLVCPWLVVALARLKGAGRAGVLALLLLALTGIAATVVVSGGFHAIDAEIVINRDLDRWARAFDALYSKPWMRAGPLLAGVGAAYLYRAPRIMDALARQRVMPVAGLVAALAVGAVATHWELFVSVSREAEIVYLATFRTTFGLCVAYVTLLALSANPVGKVLGRLLSSRLLYPMAALSYSAYLLNPIVTQLVHRALSTYIHDAGPGAMALLLPLDVCGTFLAAAVLYLLVERPFMELRPKHGPKPAEAAPSPLPDGRGTEKPGLRPGFWGLDLLDNRFPALHGMRVIAIITVVAYHVTWIFAGEQGITLDPFFFGQSLTVFFGMDLFFLLSGFLIGSILLRSLVTTGTQHIGRFYIRRVFRTFPSYYLVLTLLALSFPMTAAQKHHLPWEYLYGTNFMPLMRGQVIMFWGWSLGLEEQFYLIVPVLFFALQWLKTDKARLGMLTLLWATALVVRLVIYFRHRPWGDAELYGAVYFRTHTRFDPLVAGIILALVHQRWGKAIAAWLKDPFHRAIVALPSLGCLWVLLRPTMFGVDNLQFVHLFAWGSVTSIMYLGIVPLALYTDGAVCRWLSSHLFRRMATLGYGVYLVHIPIIDHIMVPAAKAAQDRHWSMLLVWPAALTATMMLSLAIGYALHVLVEKPSLKLRERFST